MRYAVSFVLFAVVALLLCPSTGRAAARPPPSPPASQRYIFAILGDSLSDSGNVYRASKLPDPRYYWNGRFTDGPNWVDYLQAAISQKHQFQIFNYAYGAASACRDKVMAAAYPYVKSLTDQTEAFSADVASGTVPTGKYVRLVPVQWIGSNDVLFTYNRALAANITLTDESLGALVKSLVECRIASARALAAIPGVKNVVLVPIAPLHSAPSVRAPMKAKIRELGDVITQYTASAVASLQASLDAANTGVKVHLLGNYTWIEDGFSSIRPPYKQYNVSCFVNPRGAINAIRDEDNVTICNNPTERLFFDESHPETRFHQWFAMTGFLPRMRQLRLLP